MAEQEGVSGAVVAVASCMAVVDVLLLLLYWYGVVCRCVCFSIMCAIDAVLGLHAVFLQASLAQVGQLQEARRFDC